MLTPSTTLTGHRPRRRPDDCTAGTGAGDEQHVPTEVRALLISPSTLSVSCAAGRWRRTPAGRPAWRWICRTGTQSLRGMADRREMLQPYPENQNNGVRMGRTARPKGQRLLVLDELLLHGLLLFRIPRQLPCASQGQSSRGWSEFAVNKHGDQNGNATIRPHRIIIPMSMPSVQRRYGAGRGGTKVWVSPGRASGAGKESDALIAHLGQGLARGISTT